MHIRFTKGNYMALIKGQEKFLRAKMVQVPKVIN